MLRQLPQKHAIEEKNSEAFMSGLSTPAPGNAQNLPRRQVALLKVVLAKGRVPIVVNIRIGEIRKDDEGGPGLGSSPGPGSPRSKRSIRGRSPGPGSPKASARPKAEEKDQDLAVQGELPLAEEAEGQLCRDGANADIRCTCPYPTKTTKLKESMLWNHKAQSDLYREASGRVKGGAHQVEGGGLEEVNRNALDLREEELHRSLQDVHGDSNM
ncbi:hypothetical protein COOONC_17794 [Cooperia oncophora]